ncbi:ParB/RepB/Spo0J family partition protein [Granulicella mallensis]|uniref:ParB family chromosome partitioning protein n=1 Tax=Granulicella mallensis TaxID=940614 RepID=A0A7W8E9X9_9BACT|nr:ParB/RepB/Spo0J family partition protein [Granulicella mallensis]MBB5064983.1 ParB family chromosome partitioning protein [Granulicella mallensis]
MNTAIVNNVPRELPIAILSESPTNPRRVFDEAFLKELASSIDSQGVLASLLVRPKNQRYEIVFGAQRFRAAQIAGKESVPVEIRDMTDAQVMEAQLVENLQRRDVHPLEEANSFKGLLDLEEPKYSIEQIAVKIGKPPAYIATRLKLTELAEVVIDEFYREEIGIGHALLLAKLPLDKQGEALKACFREDWSASSDRKAKRLLLPVRNLQTWVEQNILLVLKDAPFDKKDAHLVAIAGSCVDCPKRTGHNKLLFSDLSKQDACSDPNCYQAKVDAHVANAIAAKPKLVQISTGYTKPQEGSAVVPRGKYVAITGEKPKDKEQAQRPQYKTCKYTTEAIIAEGDGKGEVQKVCANPACPIHHPKKQQSNVDASYKVRQEKERREQAISHATGVRTLAAIAAAVPVRMMKRDLFFVAERLAGILGDSHLTALARHHGIKSTKANESISKLFTAYLRQVEESKLGSVVIELTILLAAARGNSATVLRDAAVVYKVNTDAIALKVKQEFAAKEKMQVAKKGMVKAQPKDVKKAKAA